jgi:hypothetical protein
MSGRVFSLLSSSFQIPVAGATMIAKRAATLGLFIGLLIFCSIGPGFGQGFELDKTAVVPGTLDGFRSSTPQSELSPDTVEAEHNATLATLELRFTREVCRGVAQLSQIAQKCQKISSAPIPGE